jgi:hypothetical protein
MRLATHSAYGLIDQQRSDRALTIVIREIVLFFGATA